MAARTFGPDPTAIVYTWIVGFHSFGPLALGGFACFWRGRAGSVATAAALVFLWLGSVWHIASSELYLQQRRTLPLSEVVACFRDPATRAFAW